MRVKRLEIQGFKSFKDKTVLHFDHGITGIVGPNGCGKSNIVDSFFWVMGEQSYKHMRGSCSEDLIFNGSSRYNPLGMAEATLVMEIDGADSALSPSGATATDTPLKLKTKEISVTRRLYRGGEGEYFINGLPARLKDIQELFMDTGVGAKGYSVVEQGQIGRIVNSKPEERRLLIEDAAGIAKYKARKKESLRKMEATQLNLARLTDILQEIERNLGSLERQAQKARQHKKFKEELFEKEIDWGRRKAAVFRNRLSTLQDQRQKLEHELAGLRAEIQTTENNISVDQVQSLTDSKAAEEIQTIIQRYSDDLTHERSALELSKSRQSDLHAQLDSLTTEKTQLTQSIEDEKERVSVRETQVADEDEELSVVSASTRALDETVRGLRSEVDVARRQLETKRQQLMQGISDSTDLTSRAAACQSRFESSTTQLAQLTEQAEGLDQRQEEMQTNSVRIEEQTGEQIEKCEELRTQKAANRSHIDDAERALKQKEREREDAMKKLTGIRSRLQSLEELDASHEGFGDAPRAVLDWAKGRGNADQVLALADILDVTRDFEAAVEGWLGTRIESLISSDSGLAWEALQSTQKDAKGAVAIRISAPGKATSADFKKVSATLANAGCEIVGALEDYVSIRKGFSDSLTSVAARALSCVAVVKALSPEQAKALTAEAGGVSGWSFVGVDGSAMEWIGDGWILRREVVSGQEDGEAATIMRRKRAIADFKEQATAADAVYENAENVLEQAREEIVSLNEELRSTDEALQEANIQKATLERDAQQMKRALADLVREIQSVTSKKANCETMAADASHQQKEMQAKVSEIIASRKDLEATIAGHEETVTASEERLHESDSGLGEIRVREASLRERVQSLRRELESSRALISDRERRMREIDRTLERARGERDQFSGGESGIEAKIIELTAQLGIEKQSLAEIRDRMEVVNRRVKEGMAKIKELHHDGDDRQSTATNLAIESEKLSSDLGHLVQDLEQKYQPGCVDEPVPTPIQEEMTGTVVTHEMTEDDEKALYEEVDRLRERLRRLGEVNTSAIEEYEETKKRYDYLLTEKSDLEQSLVNLQDAIDHINKTSEERFQKAFASISDRFAKLFPIIFGGGKAEISLVYPEGSTDILEAGVDILAQPPGKKIVNIGLLSGGEKALTAICLIFAIFMVKPSPFCILDEVDAPLDDANIGKFNALLREMCVKSQFIVITHNKKTMELNDTLYGVTMEEPGVSKMVSIELH